MSKFALIIVFFLLPSAVLFAQVSDFLILKKGNKTIKNYFADSHIDFTTNTGAYHSGLISKLSNDTIYLKEFYIRKLPTIYGNLVDDTLGSTTRLYAYKDIYAFPKLKTKSFNFSQYGAVLLSGGVVMAVASGVSYIVSPKKASKELLYASLVAIPIGYLIVKLSNRPIIIGKRKFHFQYVNQH